MLKFNNKPEILQGSYFEIVYASSNCKKMGGKCTLTTIYDILLYRHNIVNPVIINQQ